MTNERWKFLSTTPGQTLSLEEKQEGWHFCPEFDEDLIQGCDTAFKRHCDWCGNDGRSFELPDITPVVNEDGSPTGLAAVKRPNGRKPSEL